MYVQGVSLSTTSNMDVQGVSPSTASGMDMQGVSISTASSMDVHGVSFSTNISMDARGVSLSTASSRDVQRAGCMSFHCPQFGRAGCVPFCRQEYGRNFGLSGIQSFRYRIGQQCRCPNQSGSRIRGSSPVPECSGIELWHRMLECRCRRHRHSALDADAQLWYTRIQCLRGGGIGFWALDR